MSAFENWLEVYEHEGLYQSIRRTFGFLHESYLRPRLPDSTGKYTKLNGILVPRTDTKLLDSYIGLINYEGPLLRSMNQQVEPGDRVVIVGGGYGVSAVVASRLVGSNGTVTVFEGAEKMIRIIEQTATMNSTPTVEVHQNIISEAISLYGDEGEASVISPEELPDCDVLVLDCEGAELDILSNITYTPRSVVVETHGHYGAPTSKILDLLSEYEITYNQLISESKEMSVLGARLKE